MYPRNNSSLEKFVVASRTDLSSSKLNVRVPGIPPNDYTVIVYDLTRNGLLPVLSGGTNYPAEEENITVTNPGESESKYNFAGDLHYTVIMICAQLHVINQYICSYLYIYVYVQTKKLLL